jgi:hypothetical protein
MALAGCAGDPALAAGLLNAARPSRLPEVVACWEKEFEAADFQGEYLATVAFTVEGGTGRIRDVEVRALDPVTTGGGGSGRDPAAFKACLAAALAKSALPTESNADGPGFRPPGDVAVSGLRIAFTDSPARRRTVASRRQANVLLGPRADRCHGLYAHDPPRDASVLYDEIAAAEGRAKSYGADLDLKARELQRTYDAELELGERLAADLAQPGLPDANKKRIRKALSEAGEAARRVGAKIGCTPPRRP